MQSWMPRLQGIWGPQVPLFLTAAAQAAAGSGTPR
eukprot:COSAG01_NODE_69075_length_262_cov_0.944785_1_plen_34_part_10